MTLSELPPIKDITRITYNPDDVIVVRCVGRRIPEPVAQAVKERMRKAFPVQEIVVTDEDWKIEVITPEPEPGGRPDWITTEPSP